MNEYASRPCHSNIFAENVLPWGLQPLFEHERRYHLYNVNVALYTLVMIVRVYSYKDHDDRTPPLTFRTTGYTCRCKQYIGTANMPSLLNAKKYLGSTLV